MKPILLFIVLAISGCVSMHQPRPEYSGSVPTLEEGLGRVYITAGQWEATMSFNQDLRFKYMMGPVYIDGKKVGSTGYKEHFIVDLPAGKYGIYWITKIEFESYGIQALKSALTVNAGETIYLAGDMMPNIVATHMGLIGGLTTNVNAWTKLTERASLSGGNRLVFYNKYSSLNSTSENDLILHNVITDVEYQKMLERGNRAETRQEMTPECAKKNYKNCY